MSIRFASRAKDSSGNVYVVAAPRQVDIISGTLRAAFSTEERGAESFGELLRCLDRVEPRSSAN